MSSSEKLENSKKDEASKKNDSAAEILSQESTFANTGKTKDKLDSNSIEHEVSSAKSSIEKMQDDASLTGVSNHRAILEKANYRNTTSVPDLQINSIVQSSKESATYAKTGISDDTLKQVAFASRNEINAYKNNADQAPYHSESKYDNKLDSIASKMNDGAAATGKSIDRDSYQSINKMNGGDAAYAAKLMNDNSSGNEIKQSISNGSRNISDSLNQVGAVNHQAENFKSIQEAVNSGMGAGNKGIDYSSIREISKDQSFAVGATKAASQLSVDQGRFAGSEIGGKGESSGLVKEFLSKDNIAKDLASISSSGMSEAKQALIKDSTSPGQHQPSQQLSDSLAKASPESQQGKRTDTSSPVQQEQARQNTEFKSSAPAPQEISKGLTQPESLKSERPMQQNAARQPEAESPKPSQRPETPAATSPVLAGRVEQQSNAEVASKNQTLPNAKAETASPVLESSNNRAEQGKVEQVKTEQARLEQARVEQQKSTEQSKAADQYKQNEQSKTTEQRQELKYGGDVVKTTPTVQAILPPVFISTIQTAARESHNAATTENATALRPISLVNNEQKPIAQSDANAGNKAIIPAVSLVRTDSPTSSAKVETSNNIAKPDTANNTAKLDASTHSTTRIDAQSQLTGRVEITSKGQNQSSAQNVRGQDVTTGRGQDVITGRRPGDTGSTGGNTNGGEPVAGIPGIRSIDVSGNKVIGTRTGLPGTDNGNRYLTGAEIGLILAAAGIAKARSEAAATAKENAGQKTAGTEGKIDTINTKDIAATRMPGDRLGSQLNINDILIGAKRFPGKEITLSAVLAITGTSKMRDFDHSAGMRTRSIENTITIKRTLGSKQNEMIMPPFQMDDPSKPEKEQDNSDSTLLGLLPSIPSLLRARRKMELEQQEKEKEELEEETIAQVQANALKNQRPTHQVKTGDSLISIAEAAFQDSNLAWLIADINAGKTNEHRIGDKRIVELRTGQNIDLPFPDEIKAFYMQNNRAADPDNLVTIIVENQSNRNKLESHLHDVMGLRRSAF